MDTIHSRCAGLDVHKQTVVACLRVLGADSKPVRTFATVTRDLMDLADSLAHEGVTHVAIASTGVY